MEIECVACKMRYRIKDDFIPIEDYMEKNQKTFLIILTA
jgi:hypothetical protein